MALLEIRELSVRYRTGASSIEAVRAVSLEIEQGEFVGVVGESGCGKSTLGMAVTRLLRPPAELAGGSIVFDGRDLSLLKGERLRRARHGGFAVVLQSGLNALNPVRKVEDHFVHVLRAQARVRKSAVRERAASLLERVGLEAEVLSQFPFELSGGMRQRVAIALVLSLEPRLIVFDEPTTALDVLTQRRVIDTIKRLQDDVGFAAVLISHDLGMVLETVERVVVMYGGRIVEDRAAAALVKRPLHPYTTALLGCYADPRADEVAVRGIPGSPPDLAESDDRCCSFTPRCTLFEEVCSRARPLLVGAERDRVACHLVDTTTRAPLPASASDMAVGQ